MGVWVHSFVGAKGMADLDDFSLRLLSEEEAEEVRRQSLLLSTRGFPLIDRQRLLEIASWLPEKPQGMGQPVGSRAWEHLAAMPEAVGLIKEAANLMTKPVPELPDELYLEFTQNGNRSHYEAPYRQRVVWLDKLLLAECLECKGRFLPAIEQMVLAVCAERSWTMPAHDGNLDNFNGTRLTIDLGSSARAWLLVDIDTFVGEAIQPATRAKLRAEVKRRVLEPYLKAVRSNDVSGNGWMRCNNNWNAVCTAGMVWCALALIESREERAEVLAAMEISNPWFISGFTEDGYCSEGMGYWNYGFGHYVMMGLAVRDATRGRLDIFQGEKLRKIACYARGYQIQNGLSPHFADGGGNPSQGIWALMRQVWPEAVPTSMPHLPILKGDHAAVALRGFGQEPPSADVTDDPLPMRTWFEDAQVLLTRPATGDQRPPFGAAFKGGHNAEHHNHNDIGSYVIMLDGIALLGDPGGEVYTRRTFSRDRYVSKVLNSWGHPVPVVAGQLQPPGRAFAAKVVTTEFTDDKDCIVLDLTQAYSVPQLEGLRRSFTYDRAGRSITLIDDVRFSTPCEFSVPLITYSKITRASDNTLLLRQKEHAVTVRIDVEGGAWRLDEDEIENPGRRTPTRLAVTFTEPVASARVRFIIGE